MKKVGFFQSIHLKFVLIYMLLILIAMQVIGVYFVRELEKSLVQSFKDSLTQQTNLLSYNLKQEFAKEREKTDPPLENAIKTSITDFASDRKKDIQEVRVIDPNRRLLAISNSSKQGMVGKTITDITVQRAIVQKKAEGKIEKDGNTGRRVQVMATPIEGEKGKIIGVIHIVASMEDVYKQMKDINQIFATGTVIALLVTAVLGILLAQTITRPISDMRRQAIEMAKGNYSRKVKVHSHDEIGQLALAFNNLSKKLQQARSSTESERRKLSSVLSHMTDGVIATDRKGDIILLNDPAEKMLNVSRETALDQSVLEVLGIQEEFTLDHLYEEPDSVLLDFSTRNEPYILRASFSVIQKETGKANGLIAVLYDVTEQERIDRERREFVANVSHELRTPLTTMRSYLEALSDGAWQDPNIAPQFLTVTQEETERMIRLVNALLQLSKLDSTEHRLMKEWVDFTDFFNNVIDRFEMSKEQNVIFKRSFSKKSRFIDMDADKITQVLYNIISNALKYSPEGGTVTYRLRDREDMLEISVSDQGMGIPKENVEKIFERFYRVDKARSRQMGGTGLGLAIAKEMIEAHGGSIWAKSEEGKGTTIYFTLPMAKEEEDDWE
ncbi:cell wall metabolism sensor histidine kinase WalK [Bacillus pseudomycoides]|uniref:cell wall metabolism sensor histidine kinase WalK n=1 Tax=Bacillus pseudomycoides TaxID=64104 RepID=UPI000BEE746E|nr:cell wall metabolism sensor histidine kinase WalK [Bacillus pseudomycoides]PEB42992.1 cell wall metabolism sensor histidine kinase WalK [Bacillus pseudomycoides]PGD94435.1 cell wall metabolism sensor histidine kinase WalK [Bacillus pseudomycoides]PGE04851.1 cell wall metabolism sensor histidine kinase WalK [Bacillus pseudomycoides]PHE67721.1 cell wall metabolism sensor histidine kinase WalK [Bacillus pseudomycoides]PHG22387.1 cell wall metabolism sensor histidine kinase WalK [Bacillus pseud